MDFSYLLELAKANDEKSQKDNSIKFSTKVSTAKKISKSGPKPQAINHLLNKIEDEKKKKNDEYNKKRNHLLALRADDKHSKKRVHSLINRTKGASKAVLEDAKDLTTAKGEEQCDEDDYGYESTISQQIFSKLQNKYHALPDDERLKFNKTEKSNIEDIKNRVMSSLKQKQEEELGLRKRKRNRKSKSTVEEDDGFINDGDEYKKFVGLKGEPGPEGGGSEREKEKISKGEKKKKKRSKRDIDPSLIDKKVDEYANFKYDKEKKEEKPAVGHKDKDKEKKEKKIKSGAPPSMSFEELMKVAQKKQKDPLPILDPLQELLKRKEEFKQKKNEESRPLTAKEKKELEEDRLRRLKKLGKIPPPCKDSVKEPAKSKELKSESKPQGMRNNKVIKEMTSKEMTSKEMTSKENKPIPEQPKKITDRSKYFTVAKPSSDSSSRNSPHLSQSTVKKIEAKSRVEKVPPAKLESKPKREEIFPKPSIPKRSIPPSQPKPVKRIIDSDEEDDEYDSEMDDFIDDDEPEVNYSSEISKIFKYDKSRFRNEDEDDLDDMEASFTQMQKEEVYSARVGLMEDLEDMKREEEEKKMKKLKKRKL